MKKQEFLNMVLEEANHLRKHATDQEKGKLDFLDLDVNCSDDCIYGQMTGDCNSHRAVELYSKLFSETDTKVKFGNRGSVLFSKLMSNNESSFVGKRFTPIEVYITMKESKNEALISYIKGEVNEWNP